MRLIRVQLISTKSGRWFPAGNDTGLSHAQPAERGARLCAGEERGQQQNSKTDPRQLASVSSPLEQLRSDLKADLFDVVHFLAADRIARHAAYQSSPLAP
jgi:hypothetical protein